MSSLHRRAFVTLGAGLAGSAACLPLAATASDRRAGEPHFFLLLELQGGLDPTYLFDARPLAMTAAGRVQNYLGKDPSPWVGANGVTTLASELTRPLLAFKDDFSVLSGVHMAVTFDGHEQNANYLATGNPFGGDAFFAELNGGAERAPLDFLQLGEIYGLVVGNAGAGVTLDPRAAAQLSATVARAFDPSSEPPVMELVRGRLAAAGQGAGRFSAGARRMTAGLAGARGLAGTLARMELPASPDQDPVKAALAVVSQYFLKGATRTAVITLPMQGELDTHSPVQARAQPTVYAKVVAAITTLLKTLKETPFDAAAGSSLLDVTTVLVASEFGRTLCQPGMPMDQTGTDHNPLSAQLLIGGKGVRKGLVVGASDLASLGADGTLAPFSGAHKRFDEAGLKAMGRPFDFATLTPVDALPDEYDPAHYLSVASVVNTVFMLFGVDPSRHWTLGRNLPAAKALDALLT